MNATQRHTDFDISTEMAENVVKLKPIPAARPNAANLADLHRREAHNCQQRIAESKKALKANLAAIAAHRKQLKAEFDATMLSLSADEAFARDRTAESIAEDEILARYNSAALAALGG
jgi:hypothetical protein